jgi:hypothetical protein
MTATNQSDRSPAPEILPEPVHVSDDAALPVTATEKDGPKSGRRHPVKFAVAKVMSALRGDKYMVDAYPATEHEAAAPDSAGPVAEER